MRRGYWTKILLSSVVIFGSLLAIFIQNRTLSVFKVQFQFGNESSTTTEDIIDERISDYARINLSSEERIVDYKACCGLGHRLLRHSLSFHFARMYNYTLSSDWGKCDNTLVFDYLFGGSPPSATPNPLPNSFPNQLYFANEVPGFDINRSPKCTVYSNEQRDSVNIFYRHLRATFRGKPKLDAFRKQHFHEDSVIVGLHVRAGNGETGDFTYKARQIENQQNWTLQVVERLREREVKWTQGKIVYFIASDTPTITDMLLEHLNKGPSKAVVFPQHRPEPGSGVVFGQKALESGSECLERWKEVVSDMFLLSYADVVIASRYSSMTTSVPLHSVMSRTSNKVKDRFCEMNLEASKMTCFNAMYKKGNICPEAVKYLKVAELDDSIRSTMTFEYLNSTLNYQIARRRQIAYLVRDAKFAMNSSLSL